VLNTPRSQLTVSASKVYEKKAHRQIMMMVPSPAPRAAATPPAEFTAPSDSIASATTSKLLLPCIKDWRRIATRYDKLARTFPAAVLMIGTLYWITQ
jgi:hypothetical protein